MERRRDAKEFALQSLYELRTEGITESQWHDLKVAVDLLDPDKLTVRQINGLECILNTLAAVAKR